MMNPRRNMEEFANANENDYSEGDRHCASAVPSSRTISACGKDRFFMSQSRKIITSVALMRAAAVCPRFNCISLAERAVMIDVIC
jgi:hypothetical protein